AGFARRRAGAIAGGLTLEVDNTRLPLDVEASDLSQPLGQGGLHTLRLAIRFHAALPGGRPDEPRTVGFADDNEPDRVGWREIVVTPRGDAHVLRTGAPGHGKTVMAAYLVGTRGRASDAVLLGSIVSLMHTGSVLLLGVLLFHVSRSVQLDRLYPILTFAGGVVVLAVGAWLLRARLRM